MTGRCGGSAPSCAQVAPDVILTHAPQDYMEDHMNTAGSR